MATLSEGMGFGEFGLIYEQPRSASVYAGMEGVVMAKEHHRKLLFATFQLKLDFLAQSKVFSILPGVCAIKITIEVIARTENALISLSYLFSFKSLPKGEVCYNSTASDVCVFAVSDVCSQCLLGGTFLHLRRTMFLLVPGDRCHEQTLPDAIKVDNLVVNLTVEKGFVFGPMCSPVASFPFVPPPPPPPRLPESLQDQTLRIKACEESHVQLLVADTLDVALLKFGGDVLRELSKRRAGKRKGGAGGVDSRSRVEEEVVGTGMGTGMGMGMGMQEEGNIQKL
eukprot:768079-Hanusia_phi.AAC.4